MILPKLDFPITIPSRINVTVEIQDRAGYRSVDQREPVITAIRVLPVVPVPMIVLWAHPTYVPEPPSLETVDKVVMVQRTAPHAVHRVVPVARLQPHTPVVLQTSAEPSAILVILHLLARPFLQREAPSIGHAAEYAEVLLAEPAPLLVLVHVLHRLELAEQLPKATSQMPQVLAVQCAVSEVLRQQIQLFRHVETPSIGHVAESVEDHRANHVPRTTRQLARIFVLDQHQLMPLSGPVMNPQATISQSSTAQPILLACVSFIATAPILGMVLAVYFPL